MGRAPRGLPPSASEAVHRLTALPGYTPAVPFMAAALLLLPAVGAGAIVAAAPLAAGNFRAWPVLTVNHLATLGWATLTAMGALHQLAPAMLGISARPGRQALAQGCLVLVGLAVLAVGFLTRRQGVLVAGGLVVWAGIACFVWLLARLVPRRRRWPLPGFGVAASLGYLVATASWGVVLTINWRWPFWLHLLGVAGIGTHVALGVVGWLVQLVVSVSYYLLPRFVGARPLDQGRLPAVLGLLNAGVVVLVVATAAAAYVLDRRERHGRAPLEEGRPEVRGVRRLVLAGIVVAFFAALPQLAGSIVSEIMGTVGVFLLLALGLNIVTGYAGMLHLGFSAFFLLGAYSIALLTGANLVTAFGLVAPRFSAHLDFYVALVLVVLIGAAVGALLAAPVLRLRGDYLAIVTLAFAQIAVILATSSWLQPITGGPQGLRDVTKAPLLGIGFRSAENFYYLVLVACVLAVYVSWRLAWSRTGRAWNAMREDEQVAEAMGVPTGRYKMLGFAIGGAIGAIGGAMFAVKVGTVQPGSFEIIQSITILAVVILGGLGSVPGVVLGALVLLGLPGLLTQLEEYRFLIYGASLVAIMILRPQGLIPNVRRMRELQEEERTQDAWQQIFAARQEEEAAEGATEAAS